MPSRTHHTRHPAVSGSAPRFLRLRALPFALAAIAFAALPGCGFKPNALPPTTGTGGSSPAIDGGSTGGSTGTGGSTSQPAATSLTLSPAAATMTVTNTSPPQTQQYTVMGVVNGQTVDLTSKAIFSATPPNIVSIDSTGLATSTGQAGGNVTVTAVVGTVSATAKLTVHYSFTGNDPTMGMMGALPTDPSPIFTTTSNDTTRSPALVYPNDGVLFPPNITGVEVHFQPGSTSNTLFDVSLAGALVKADIFVRCTAPAGINGCIYAVDPSLWQAVAVGNAGQGQVSLVVRGTDDSGTSVGDSGPFHMQFAQDNVDGALYYWTTSGKSAIMRWDFSAATTAQMAQPYLTPTQTDGKTCVGCHALALDGSKLVASAGGQGDGRLLLWNVATNAAMQPFPLTQRSQFESWNSDGTQFVGVYGDAQSTTRSAKAGPVNLMIFDGMTGAVTSTIDLAGARGDHPDWTKAGADAPNRIVFTSADPTASTTDQRPATGGIDYVENDGTGWGPPQMLVPSVLGKNRYYPAISPDGTLVVYDESTCSGTATAGAAPDVSCDADTDATATMFLTTFAGATPVSLDNANRPGVADGSTTALTNSFPKFSPFIEKLSELQQIVWLTFSSTRQYGLRAPPASTTDSNETKVGTLIWMVGIVPGVGGGDPSYTAFCLPFQDITTSNHIAQWAKYFLKGPG